MAEVSNGLADRVVADDEETKMDTFLQLSTEPSSLLLRPPFNLENCPTSEFVVSLSASLYFNPPIYLLQILQPTQILQPDTSTHPDISTPTSASDSIDQEA